LVRKPLVQKQLEWFERTAFQAAKVRACQGGEPLRRSMLRFLRTVSAANSPVLSTLKVQQKARTFFMPNLAVVLSGMLIACSATAKWISGQEYTTRLERTLSDAGVPGIAAFPRERFQTVGHRQTGDIFHALVAQLAGETQTKRTSVAHRKLAAVHPVG